MSTLVDKTTLALCALLAIGSGCSSRSKDQHRASARDAAVADAWVGPEIPVLEDECPPGTTRKEKVGADGTKEDWCERPGGQRHGPNRFFFASGAKEIHAMYVDGKVEGPMVAFYENGAKRQHSVYRNGLAEGPFTIWSESGDLVRTGFDRRGRHEGVVTDYGGDHGTKWQETHYLHGVEHGMLIEWDRHGKVSRRAKYDHGKLIWDSQADAGAARDP